MVSSRRNQPTFDNGKPIVALDIDGTLGDYHSHFLRFAEGYIGRPMPDPRDINPGQSLTRHMGVSKATYRAAKLAYRQGGLKRSMPVYEGARELTVSLRRAGAEVWICTTRPYLRLDNIDPDTRHWLRRNGIQFDAVLWGEHKYRDLVKSVGNQRVAAVLDDLPEMVGQARELGIGMGLASDGGSAVFLRDQPYNRYVDNAWPRVQDLEGARIQMLDAVAAWKENGRG